MVVILILTGDDIFPPLSVVEIPVDRELDAVFELSLRQPSEFIMDLCRIDRITHIVSLTIRNICDKALGLAEFLADQLNDIDITLLVMSADIIDLTDGSLVDDKVDSFAVILNIEPVTYIQSFAVDRERLIVKRIGDHQGDQLLGEVVRSVVIRAAADGYGQTVSPVVCKHQKIGRCLGRTVRRARMKGSGLRKEQVRPVKRKVSVNFICRYLMISDVSVFTACIHKNGRTDDVGFKEYLRILDRTVDMRLCSEVNDYVGLLIFEDLIYGRSIADKIFQLPSIFGTEVKLISSLVIGCFIVNLYAQRVICFPCPLPPYF